MLDVFTQVTVCLVVFLRKPSFDLTVQKVKISRRHALAVLKYISTLSDLLCSQTEEVCYSSPLAASTHLLNVDDDV